MTTTAEKTVRPSVAIQRQAASPLFMRKSGDNFFGGDERSFFGASSFIQPKLSVSQPDDPQEKEADQMAHRVMSMPESAPAVAEPQKKDELQRAQEEELQKMDAPAGDKEIQRMIMRAEATDKKEEEVQRAAKEDDQEVQRAEAEDKKIDRAANDEKEEVQRKGYEGIHRKEDKEDKDEVQRKCADCEEKDKAVQRKPVSFLSHSRVHRSGRGPPAESDHSFEQGLQNTRGMGSALPADTRMQMEQGFQADFSGVRIHTGSTAVQMSNQINAQAFTYGNDIYFNSNKYAPSSTEGKHLLAHELTHTIQQGASNHTAHAPPTAASTSVSRRSIARKIILSRKKQIQRSASNLAAAVGFAKGEAGKVIANKEGGDGFRVGWQQLLEYFQTTLGKEKIIAGNQAGDSTSVPEMAIKKKQTAHNVAVILPDGKPGTGDRDAMPSWCGIFVFWALNKAGLPMKKWVLGQMTIPPEAQIPPGTAPPPGAIAYRNMRSHYGMVEHADGTSVTTINGNTAGADNLGGEVQVQTHTLDNWTAFIDPMKLIEGTVRNPGSGATEKPKTLDEMRRELFRVNRKADTQEEDKNMQARPEAGTPEKDSIQPKTETTAPAEQKKEELQRKEEKPDKEQSVQARSFEHADANDDRKEQPDVQRKSGPKVQRGIFGDAIDAIGGAIDSAVEWVGDKLEEGKRWLLRQISDLVMNVPGYKALRVALGRDPVSGDDVERNGKNFIDAALDIMPGGDLLKQKMEELGIMGEAELFVDRAFTRVDNLINGIFGAFAQFWSGIGPGSLTDVTGTFRQLETLFTTFFDTIKEFVKGIASDFLEFVKKALLIPLGTYIKTKTRFWDLLCLAMGKDPLTDEERPLTGANVLNAFLNLSEWGVEQRKKMQETGTFNKVAAWIDRGIAIFKRSYHELKAAFLGLWNYVNIHSLMNPVETFTAIFNSFWRPIARIGEYVIETGIMILKIVKDVLFKWISNKAKEQRPYYLATVLIGKDPFTGEVVERSTENIIKGFMLLTENGEEQFNKMKESGAIARAVQKIDAAVKTLGFTWAYVKGLFTALWESFKWTDLLVPVMAFVRIIDTFKDPFIRLVRFVVTVVMALIEVILRMMGFPVDLVFKIIDNAKKAWGLIKSNVPAFFSNILKAIKQGFTQFFDNFLKHLVNGLVDWFFDQLKDVGVTRPADFSLGSIIKLVMQILGITMEKIWKKLGDKIGHDKVAKIRGAIDKVTGILKFIRDVQEKGIGAIWEYIQEQLSNLWNKVLEAATKWIMEKIITQITVKLLSMLDPTGIMAVVNSVIAIYKAIQSAIEYFTRMLGIINSFIEGIIEIAEGNIKKAADFLEQSMANAIPIMIGFLANQVGLGKIGRKIVEVIEKIQETVDKALDWLVDKAVSMATSFLNTLKQGVAAVRNWWGARTPAPTKDGVQHTLYFEGSGASARLMIQTTPMTVRAYVTQVQSQNNLTATQVQPALNTVTQIETKEKESATNEEQETKKANDITMLMQTLATDLGALPMGATGTNSPPIFGGKHQGKFGSSATVAYLAAPFTLGTEPGVSDAVYDKINARRHLEGSYYVKGHLLNDNLGGTGQDWSNLTPLNRDANKAHQLNFEDIVKTAVNGTSARGAVPAAMEGYMKGFSVGAIYGRSDPPALTHLKDDDKDEPLPPGADPKWDPLTLQNVLEGEKLVPSTLQCRATIKGKNETAERAVTYTVTNDISYGNMGAYQAGDQPIEQVVLADLVDPSITNEAQMAARFSGIRLIGPARARMIYNAFKTKGRITNGKSDIGIGLLALNKNNPGKRITSGTLTWPAATPAAAPPTPAPAAPAAAATPE